jgi:chitinase
VGIASYGRSFRMADPACTGPACTYTGSATVSDAEPGNCTQTAGYLANGEIRDIIRGATAGLPGYVAQHEYDSAAGSDVLRFGTKGNGVTDWVAYMDGDTKNSRVQWIQGLNFAGASDWAIDLEG